MDRYIANIDQRAQEMMNSLVHQLARAQGVTETLKDVEQMVWVGSMNNILESATEIVNTQIIYA